MCSHEPPNKIQLGIPWKALDLRWCRRAHQGHQGPAGEIFAETQRREFSAHLWAPNGALTKSTIKSPPLLLRLLYWGRCQPGVWAGSDFSWHLDYEEIEQCLSKYNKCQRSELLKRPGFLMSRWTCQPDELKQGAMGWDILCALPSSALGSLLQWEEMCVQEKHPKSQQGSVVLLHQIWAPQCSLFSKKIHKITPFFPYKQSHEESHKLLPDQLSNCIPPSRHLRSTTTFILIKPKCYWRSILNTGLKEVTTNQWGIP